MSLFALSGAELLRNTRWRTVSGKGTIGSAKVNADGVTLLRKGDKGFFFYYNANDEYKITPGKNYRVTVKYSGSVDVNIMLQMPGGKRTPYPVAKGKDGIVELDFCAGSDESKLRIHVFPAKSGKVLISSIAVNEIIPSDNLLESRQISWRTANANGSKGTFSIKNDIVSIRKTNADGYLAFLANPSDFNTVAGKHYLISFTITPRSGNTSCNMMVQMTGAKRRPFPNIQAKYNTIGKTEVINFAYTARSDETKVRPHLLVRGKGTVELSNFTVKEISEKKLQKILDSNLVKQHEFDGNALLEKWQPHGVSAAINSKKTHIEFISSPNGGIFCDALSWKAANIKSLELTCKFSGEGGYLRCDFTSTDGKRNFSGYIGHSIIPDGKWHKIMFPVGDAPAWRGEIKSVKFSFFGKTSAIGFARLSALPYSNRIDNIVPRGEYTLSRISGREKAELLLLDSDYNVIETITLKEQDKSVKFTAPEMTMLARKVPKNAQLLLTLNNLKKLDLPPAFWRGKLIWCQNGFGPDAANVFFHKEFYLEAPPEEASIVLSGDDAFELFINGQFAGKGSNWQTPGKFDIASLLKTGKNKIDVKVYNAQAWGMLLGELYTKVNGKSSYIYTDESWKCKIGGSNIPDNFPLPAFVLGSPPLAPWGTRVYYRYVGPVSNINIIDSTVPGEFTLSTDITPEVDTDKLALELHTPDGKKRNLTALITPNTGKWFPGEKITVKYRLNNDIHSGSLYIKEDFLNITGNASIGTLKGRKVPKKPLSEVKIVNSGKRPKIVINGKEHLPVYSYLAAGYSDFPDSRWYQVRNSKVSGHKIMRFSFALETFWKGKEEFDFSHVDSLFDTVEMHAPGTKVIIQIRCSMPDWYLNENPGERVTYFGNAPYHRQKDKQALTSKKWLTDASVILRKGLRYLINSPYADRIIGVSVSEGWNSEWFHSYQDDNNKFAMAGYAPADYATFRAFLKEKYSTDAALSEAWQMKNVTIDTAPMPTLEQIMSSRAGCLLDVKKEKQLIDWFTYRNRAIGEAIVTFCKVVKEESNNKWLAGAYYGYFLAFSNIFNRLQTVGHLDIERVARSPYVDFVTAPSFYTWRYPGQGDAVMQLAESFSSQGKLPIVEQDLRNYSEPSVYEIRNGMASTVETSIGALERCFALLMTRGTGTHWLDLYDNCIREKIILEHIRKGNEAVKSLPEVQNTTPIELCLVADSTSAMYSKHNAGDGLATAAVGELRRKLNETSLPFRVVMLRDLLDSSRVPPHKLYIFCNLVMLSKADKIALQSRLQKENAAALWLYSAGVSTENSGPSADNMSDFLGIKFVRDDRIAQKQLKWNFAGKSGKCINFTRTFPWFVPVSGFEKVYGTSDDNRPALVEWNKNGVRNIFSTLMNLPPELLKEIARDSGLHIYSESDDPVLVGNDVIALHAKSGGTKKLNTLPGTILVPILGPHKKVLKSGEEFETVAGRTYIFHVQKNSVFL